MYQYPILLFTELAYHMRPCESMKNSRMEISGCGYGYSTTSPVLGSNRPMVSCSCEAYQIILLRSMPMAEGLAAGAGKLHSLNASVLGSKRPSLFPPRSLNHTMLFSSTSKRCGLPLVGGGNFVKFSLLLVFARE